MTRSICIFLLAIFSNLVALPTANSSEDKTLLVVGDSLSAAYGLPPNTGWVDLLTEKLSKETSWKVKNASISGETTDGGARRIAQLLSSHQPSVVLIELGGNDGLRGFPPNVSYKNLEDIIKKSQTSGAKVILAGIHLPPNYGQKYEQMFYGNYLKLQEKYKVALIPFILENIGEKAELMQKDGIHPNLTAQPMILDNVWPYLEPLLD